MSQAAGSDNENDTESDSLFAKPAKWLRDTTIETREGTCVAVKSSTEAKTGDFVIC